MSVEAVHENVTFDEVALTAWRFVGTVGAVASCMVCVVVPCVAEDGPELLPAAS